MYSILSSVLSSIFRLLWNTVRNQTGALTEEKCRQILVQDLETIKSKLEGLTRKDLLSSFCFLKEGVCRLKTSIDKPNVKRGETTKHETVIHRDCPDFERRAKTDTGSQSKLMESSLHNIFNETRSLSTMLKTLNSVSSGRYLAAKESFKEARKEATRAFSNVALSTEDRILATKLRMISAILENLEDGDGAVSDCMMYLEALHSLPAIQAAYVLYCKCAKCKGTREMDGIKRKEILAKIRSIERIHLVMYDFTKEFARNPPEFLLKWPTINVNEKSIHPVYEKNDTMAISYQMPTRNTSSEKTGVSIHGQMLNTFCSAVNSKGEIIAMSWNDDSIMLLTPTGEVKVFCSLPLDICLPMHSIAIDDEDNVYILTRFEKQGEKNIIEILVFNADGSMKRQHPFEFPGKTETSCFSICVNDRKRVFIHGRGDDQLYVYNTTTSTVSGFPLGRMFNTPLCLSAWKKSLLLVAPKFQDIVYGYTETGKMVLEIQTPYEIHGLASREVTQQFIILVCVHPKNSYKLLTYSFGGKRRQISPELPDEWDEFGKLTSHSSGLLALVHNKGVVYI